MVDLFRIFIHFMSFCFKESFQLIINVILSEGGYCLSFFLRLDKELVEFQIMLLEFVSAGNFTASSRYCSTY